MESNVQGLIALLVGIVFGSLVTLLLTSKRDTSAQILIKNNIDSRGYNMHKVPFANVVHNIIKLLEETIELYLEIEDSLPFDFRLDLARSMQLRCRTVFDEMTRNKDGFYLTNAVFRLQRIYSELADCQVVLLNISGVIDQGIESFDIIDEALSKSTNDIEKSIR